VWYVDTPGHYRRLEGGLYQTFSTALRRDRWYLGEANRWFEKWATVDPLRLTESIEVKLIHQMLKFTTTQAPPSKEMERKCLEKFETILTGKRNPKRFNDNHKKFQLALNVYLDTTDYKEG
jgi:hypothetical protein